MKYLDYEGLQQYNTLIKQFINNYVPDRAFSADVATALKNAAHPNSTVKFAVCSQAEYDALQTYQENVVYIITDDVYEVVYTYANPILDGTESILNGIKIQGINYKIPSGTEDITEQDIQDEYDASFVQPEVVTEGNNITFTNDVIETDGDDITINADSTFGTDNAIYL